MKLTRIPHLDGDAGVQQTIRQMRRLILSGKKSPEVHELAARILKAARVPSFDWEGEGRAIYESVRRNLRFTLDPDGHETLTDAPNIIRLGIGDCDDFTVLICSLMQTIGCACRIVTIATQASQGEFCHVYPEALINGRWVAMDAARKDPAFGKEPANYTRKRVWELDTEGYTDMRGLGSTHNSIAPGQGPQGAFRANVYPPFRVAAPTGTYLPGWPIAPRHQQKRPTVHGLGAYGQPAARKALRGMAFDAGDLTDIITAGTTGAANIITAERASPYNLVPTTSQQRGGTPPPGSYGGPPYPPVPFSIGGIGTGTLLLVGGGILAAVLIAKK
jgi:hypothetical protein